MWLLVMFDLPVDTPGNRRIANKFREYLKDLGFEMSQLSIYMRYSSGKEHVQNIIGKVKKGLPSGGKVDILCFTDKQYEKIVSFRGGLPEKRGKKQQQLRLF
ncbi:MAG: CRISPR-associated endonuclease Cas2 [Desulfobacteraceae bacterium]